MTDWFLDHPPPPLSMGLAKVENGFGTEENVGIFSLFRHFWKKTSLVDLSRPSLPEVESEFSLKVA